MKLPDNVEDNLQNIRLILLDVDGVLTDGKIGLLPSGEEIKFFSVYDGLAIRLAQRAGLEVGFISGRRSKEVDVRATELGIKLVFQGSKNKVDNFEQILKERKLISDQVAYVGDDLPDIALLGRVGFSAAPSNAIESVRRLVHYVTHAKGGEGAVREVIEILLKTSGRWERLMEVVEE